VELEYLHHHLGMLRYRHIHPENIRGGEKMDGILVSVSTVLCVDENYCVVCMGGVVTTLLQL
jgi:hypothetical protein